MAQSPYAIRKGFEYQDLHACLAILTRLDSDSLDLDFTIESDEVDHIDDLVFFESQTEAVCTQIKFHVDQGHVESFDSLTKRKTMKSRCILEKLYRGWKQLRDDGFDKVRIEFISSNPAEPGRGNLGPAIATATGLFHEKLFSTSYYTKPFERIKNVLGIDEQELRLFSSQVEWRFAEASIEGLRRQISRLLKRMHLPSDPDAVDCLLDIIGSLATAQTRQRLSLRSFAQLMWATSRFRDACEQRFTDIDFGASQQRRTGLLKVAIVSLECLPAFYSSRADCLDEPFPFTDYRQGISAVDREGLFDAQREGWRSEYVQWHNGRLDAVLSQLVSREVDLLVFPRFSLPLATACNVARWCQKSGVHSVIGGHTLAETDRERLRYESELNIPLTPLGTADGSSELIIDALIRHDRAGRYSTSRLDSPFSKSETVVDPVSPVSIETRDGWAQVVLLPSRAVARDYLHGSPSRPELVVVSGGVHSLDVRDELLLAKGFEGVPILTCSSDTHIVGTVMNLDGAQSGVTFGDGWEGVRSFTISYSRAHNGWTAEVVHDEDMPLVYSINSGEFDPSQYEGLRGLPLSRQDAIEQLQHGNVDRVIICGGESSSEFFYRRAKQCDSAVREKISQASPKQITDLATTLSVITTASEKYRQEAFLPILYSVPAQVLPARRLRQFVNRTKEKGELAKFLASTSNKNILVAHGPPGIGKRELVSEIQRLQPDRDRWVRFKCPDNARLTESVAQLLVRLGTNEAVPGAVDQSTFSKLDAALRGQGTRVLVLEDAHNLPIGADHAEHTALLDLLSRLCLETLPKYKVIMVSEWRGHLQFSGSHRLDMLSVGGLETQYVVELVQEHLVHSPCRYEQPSTDDIWSIAAKVHGHPLLAQLAAVLLQDNSLAEISERLYARIEVKDFVLRRLLGGMLLTDKELRVLEFASILRLPVTSDAFLATSGPTARALVGELLDRFLMYSDGEKVGLHPILAEYFSSGINSQDDLKRHHGTAFDYYSKMSQRRSLTVEERNQYVFHGVSSGKSMDFADMQMFAGAIRTAIDDAVRGKDWLAVESAAKTLLSVWPFDVFGQIAMAIALDATDRQHLAAEYNTAIEQVSQDTLWISLEFVKSLIRRRDFDNAERNLAVIRQRFSDNPRVMLAEAQLYDGRGETDNAVSTCEDVLKRPSLKENDAFHAGLILKNLGRSDLLITHLEGQYNQTSFRHDGLLRLYALALVVSNHDPQDGLQVLSELWNASPDNGSIIADYATALVAAGRQLDAQKILRQGVESGTARSYRRGDVLEAYAAFYHHRQDFLNAFQRYREAISLSRFQLHLYRKFANCLLDAAANYRADGLQSQEDSAVGEAKQVLEKLLHLAPDDAWAANAIQLAENRTYRT